MQAMATHKAKPTIRQCDPEPAKQSAWIAMKPIAASATGLANAAMGQSFHIGAS